MMQKNRLRWLSLLTRMKPDGVPIKTMFVETTENKGKMQIRKYKVEY